MKQGIHYKFGWLTTLYRDCKGTSFIEMGLMSPVLISLVLGTAEFGRAFQHHHVINKAMRDTGRYLARVPVSCPSGGGAGTVTNSSDVTDAKNLAMYGYTSTSGHTARISYWTNPSTIGIQITCFDNAAGTYRGRDRIPLITVTTTVTYHDIGFMSTLGFSAMTFSVRHQQMHIGE